MRGEWLPEASCRAWMEREEEARSHEERKLRKNPSVLGIEAERVSGGGGGGGPNGKQEDQEDGTLSRVGNGAASRFLGK